MGNDQSEAHVLNVLHLSDLHMGMGEQKWMWATFRTAFFSDLEAMHAKSGPWDLVIFSGDLTQRGSKEEFNLLTENIIALWKRLAQLGSVPKLFVVPGNHDLQRPQSLDPTAKVLNLWWDDKDVQGDFWKTDSSYRIFVNSLFKNYSEWREALSTAGIELINDVEGLVSGDCSAILQKGSTTVGLVGINSTWLQLNASDWRGSLCIHPRQLNAVTSDDPDGWCSNNTFNLIVTHHPVDWLHPNSRQLWTTEINTHSRFDAHLFGHMHESLTRSESIVGGPQRHSIQAASLFGLEYFGNDEIRAHGYSAFSLSTKGNERGMRVWPRKATITKDGTRKMVPDNEWTLLDDNYCDIHFQSRGGKTVSQEQAVSNSPPVSVAGSAALQLLIRPNTFSNAALAVRRTEREYMVAALKGRRFGWLVSDWGLGGDEFLNCVQNQVFTKRSEIYYLDISRYSSRDDFLSGVRSQLGCSFEELCKGMDAVGSCTLVLDDFTPQPGSPGFEIELLSIVDAVLDFCEQAIVVIRSRHTPSTNNTAAVVDLQPLDEPDTLSYIVAHQFGGAHLQDRDVISRIFRHSGGVPSRIDSILRDLKVVGIDGLLDLDIDVAGKGALIETNAHPAVVDAIQKLEKSDDESEQRVFSLLKVLSIFPQGELLNRIKRFFSKPFWPAQAHLLIERALIDAVAIPSFEQNSKLSNQGDALTVRRSVREHLMQVMSSEELSALNRRALSLYFGDEWEVNGIRSSADIKFSSPRCGSFEINNACTLILRAVHEAVEAGDKKKVKSAAALTSAFAAQLKKGDHFRSIVTLLGDTLPIFERYRDESDPTLDIDYADQRYCLALRMIGQAEDAYSRLLVLKERKLPKPLRQNVLLSLALCMQSLKQPVDDVMAVAQECLDIDKKSQVALQARSILISGMPAEVQQAKLRELQIEAIRKKAHVVVNNIALELATAEADPEEQKTLYAKASQDATNSGDFYNAVRSTLNLARITVKESGVLSDKLLIDCTRIYSYLYNQRMDGLFNLCHRVLWEAFEATGDQKNLLQLFRHSSLIWRIRANDGKEREYIEQLAKTLGARLRASILTDDRNLRYFISRSAPQELPEPIALS